MNTLVLSATNLHEFKQGNETVFKDICSFYYTPLFHFANSIIHNEAEAQEITSDTFIHAWRYRARFETGCNIKSFLFTTARNACFNFLKKNKRDINNSNTYARYSHDDAYEVPLPLLPMHTDVMAIIYEEIDRLPARCKEIFKLSYLDNLAPRDIAGKLNINENTVATQKKRGLVLLRKALAERNLDLTAFLFFILFYKLP
jgi:RNA polymerase sigma-70 factor (family 1)